MGNVYVSALTESSLFDLLCCQRKHRDYFNHDFDDDIAHHRSGWNRRIYLKTPEEILQAFKEFKKSVVARGDPTCSLAQYYVRFGLSACCLVQGTYGEENINAREHGICW